MAKERMAMGCGLFGINFGACADPATTLAVAQAARVLIDNED